MMGYKLLKGNPETALADANTVVLTKEQAQVYFGNEDPMGKILRMQDDDNNDELVKVTGVIESVPANTHLKFSVLFSYKTLHNRKGRQPDYAMQRFEGWLRNDMYTFVKLRAGTDAVALEQKLPDVVALHKAQPAGGHPNDVLHLQRLTDIHLTSALADEPETNGDQMIVTFLGVIGLFVLAIGWINYVNLSTAQATERAKEVGVRKTLGAGRFQLIRHFLGEASVINLAAMIAAIALTGVVLPFFNSLSGLSLSIGNLLEGWFVLLMIGLWIFGTILSGFYPALILSGFRPAVVLKGKLKSTNKGVVLRKALVVFQFTASVVLIAGTIIVYNQLNFMMHQNIGVNIDQVIVIPRPGINPPRGGTGRMEAFRNEVKKRAPVDFVTGSSTVPGMQREFKNPVKKYGAPDEDAVRLRLNSMDYEFISVFEMKILAGRGFSESHPDDPDTAVVITESAAKALGFKSPALAIGQTLTISGWNWNPIVVGVVNDYHQVSLKKSLQPTVFFCDLSGGEYYSMRIATRDLNTSIDQIRSAWSISFPGNPFEYFFLDQYFNNQYNNERRFGSLFLVFSGLALLIGCFGLFGLSAFTATQRTKEIGIRKVLGSSEGALFLLLSLDYIKLIAVSILIGIPVVSIMMTRWLSTFPYHTGIDRIVFVVAAVVVVGISMLTISAQIIRASRANPVEALKYE